VRKLNLSPETPLRESRLVGELMLGTDTCTPLNCYGLTPSTGTGTGVIAGY